jgi:HK97 family phage major capsid protein
MSEVVRELKESFDKIKNAFETQFKDAVTKGETERKELGTRLGLTTEKIEKIEADFVKHDELWEKYRAEEAAREAKWQFMEESVLKALRPPAGDGGQVTEMKPELQKFFSDEKSFTKFVRAGEERMNADEVKALATSDDASGGFLMPLNRVQRIIELNVLSSPIRQIATVDTIATGDALEIPKEGSTVFATGWVSEMGSRSETVAGTMALERIPVHEMYANPFATQKMIDDVAYDIEGYITRKLAQQFAKTEATAFCTGTMVGQPEGIAVNADVGTAAVAASAVFTAPLLITLQHTLEEPYASNATWVAKRIALGLIRQLALGTSYSDFLWQPGIAADKPPTLLGNPYVAANDVATPVSGTTGDKVIYFGDFRAGYRIVDRMGITLLRDPFTNKPYVEFYSTKRVGGQVVLPEAIKIGTWAT